METVKTDNEENKKQLSTRNPLKPTPAFIGASWMVLIIGTISYCVGARQSRRVGSY